MVTEVEAEAVVEEVEDWLTVVEVKLVVGADSHGGSEGSWGGGFYSGGSYWSSEEEELEVEVDQQPEVEVVIILGWFLWSSGWCVSKETKLRKENEEDDKSRGEE